MFVARIDARLDRNIGVREFFDFAGRYKNNCKNLKLHAKRPSQIGKKSVNERVKECCNGQDSS